jgi:hypothetical protein
LNFLAAFSSEAISSALWSDSYALLSRQKSSSFGGDASVRATSSRRRGEKIQVKQDLF